MSAASYQTPPELSPSEMVDDVASWPRTLGLTGFMAACLGVLILILNGVNAKLPIQFGNNFGFTSIVIGMVLMLLHASRDTDQVIRRLYGNVGGLGLPLTGIILSLMPLLISATRSLPEGEERKIVSLFFPYGWACFFSGLFFLIVFCKNETEEASRKIGLFALGGFGVAFSLTGFIVGNIVSAFVLTYGSVLVLLGLAYLIAYISQVGGADLEGYKPAVRIGWLGLAVVAIALIRTLIPHEKPYFIPGGLFLMLLGGAFAAASLFMVSDRKLIVLTRRELAAYFYSPIAYIVLYVFVGAGMLNYYMFTERLARMPLAEPIFGQFMLSAIYWAFAVVFIVPMVSMRLISEEKRTGTYEVLMCAPVSESTVLLSKLFGGVIFYMLTWSVWGIYLLALRAEGGPPFEYRPILSFSLALLLSGFAMISMGLFFSSLTKNQIIAAGLTFFGMLVYVALFFASQMAKPDSPQQAIFTHLNFLNLWFESIEGRVHVKDMVLQFSMTFFWYFLALKTLEARRWG